MKKYIFSYIFKNQTYINLRRGIMYRRILILLVSVVIACSANAVTNLLTNGNFDANAANPDGWTPWIGNVTIPPTQSCGIEPGTGYSYNGTRSLKLWSAHVWPVVEVTQVFPISAGQAFYVDFVYMARLTPTSGTADYQINYYSTPDGNTLNYISWEWGDLWTPEHAPAPNPDAWMPFSKQFTAPAGAQSARLWLRAYDYTTMYYDEVFAGGHDANQASNPVPNFLNRNVPGADPNNLTVGPKLSWTSGTGATSHDVYFGTSYADVNSANHSVPAGIFKGNRTVPNYNTLPLLNPQTVYWWRIDEIGSSTTTKGKIWRFTTAANNIDDFESYTSNPISNYWKVAGGASISVETPTSPATTDYNAMKFDYSNSGSPYYSEANYPLPLGKRNWTLYNAKV
jgi:hypothetical protein